MKLKYTWKIISWQYISITVHFWRAVSFKQHNEFQVQLTLLLWGQFHEYFKNSQPRVQFYWFLYKKVYSVIEMLDYLSKTQIMNLKEFIRDNKNYIATLFANWIWDNIYWWEYELNFDKSFLHYNAKKKLCTKASLIWLWILNTRQGTARLWKKSTMWGIS